jgi:riboflavin kinase/FMN adenylyltransferase
MELIRGDYNLRERHRGCVATIGNFDGVHLGHQLVLDRLKAASADHGLPSLVILFEPQSAEYFARGEVPPRLTRLREKFKLLEDFGIDRLLVLRFDARLAALSAARFTEEILVSGLAVRSLIVGHDFKFGSRREGRFETLRVFGARHGFDVIRTEPYVVDGHRVSSSRIRAYLLSGDVASAARFLGHRYSMSGRVVHGGKRGREIGFPTANLNLHRLRAPLNGIYAAEVRGLAAQPLSSVAYIGSRPIVDDPNFILEVHIFDYDDDCYGRHISVDFIGNVRDEMHFDSFEALRDQIAMDCEAARAILTASG